MDERYLNQARDRVQQTRSGYVQGSGRESDASTAYETGAPQTPAPTAPLLQHTGQQLENAVQRLNELINRVRSAKHTVFGVTPSGTAAATPAAQKEPTVGDIIRGTTGTLHDRLSELEYETSQLINQLL